MTKPDERPTPETDALHTALVRASEDPRTWIKGKDYCDMHDHAERLERERDALREALRDCPDALVGTLTPSGCEILCKPTWSTEHECCHWDEIQSAKEPQP